MQVMIGFLLVTFVAAVWRSGRKSPGNVVLMMMAVLVAGALLSHKVA